MKIKAINITVNGKPYRIWDPVVTYEQLADMAGIPISNDLRAAARQKSITVGDGHHVNVSW